MRRSLYLGDAVYEVIAEPAYQVRVTSDNTDERSLFLGRNASLCWPRSSHVRNEHRSHRSSLLQRTQLA